MTNTTDTNELKVTSTKKEYRIDGYSLRFSAFLDAIDFPSSGRYTYGAAISSASVNTFKSWCLDDVIPKTFSETEKTLELFLGYTGKAAFPVKIIMAWVLFGDMVENPLPAIKLMQADNIKA